MQLYLGCIHRRFEGDIEGQGKVTGVEYDMESFLASCVQRYLKLCEPAVSRDSGGGTPSSSSKSNKKRKKPHDESDWRMLTP